MAFKEYCGFRYSYDDKEGYSISPHFKTEKPTSFFKYYPLTENSVNALTNLYVYASHPKQFNDPFDCNANLIKFDTWEDVRHLWKHLFDSYKEQYPSLDAACEDSNQAYWTLLYKKLGLVSLTSQADNYQMWSLYAQNDGFCVEFDTNRLPFLHYGPFPINYTENIPGPVHIGDVGGNLAMLIQTNVKNDWWKYENEWRLYIPNPEGLDFKCYGTEYEMKFY